MCNRSFVVNHPKTLLGLRGPAAALTSTALCRSLHRHRSPHSLTLTLTLTLTLALPDVLQGPAGAQQPLGAAVRVRQVAPPCAWTSHRIGSGRSNHATYA